MSRRATWKVPAALSEYTVYEKAQLKARDGERVSGVTYLDAKTIHIDTSQCEKAQLLTFWHEYLHAALHELGYDKKCDNEAFVEGLAQTLSRAIIAAPKRYKS